jgi:hypothetical protein
MFFLYRYLEQLISKLPSLLVKGTFNSYGIESIQLNSLEELNRLISERFNLPLQPYSTDLRFALELVIWCLDHDESPYFAIFCSEDEAFPNKPYGVGFAPKSWSYAETAPLAICQDALYQLKGIEVSLSQDGQKP